MEILSSNEEQNVKTRGVKGSKMNDLSNGIIWWFGRFCRERIRNSRKWKAHQQGCQCEQNVFKENIARFFILEKKPVREQDVPLWELTREGKNPVSIVWVIFPLNEKENCFGHLNGFFPSKFTNIVSGFLMMKI